MKFEILKKAGYKIERTSDKIVVTSIHRPTDFLLFTFLTLWIIFAVVNAPLNDNIILRTIQYIIYTILIVAPYLILWQQWKLRLIIQKGRVQISRAIKGYTDHYKITTIDLKTEQSFNSKRVTILLNDTDNGRHKLFVFYVKAKEQRQLNDFVDQIREFIGIQARVGEAK